jgi:predicted phage baseplate assembly protein
MSAVTPGLPLPNLDDRRWADLVDEGRTLIPLYAPEWTDHNLSDPGITLMELFAWVAEQGIFRIDRVGPEQVRKFLALAGLAPAPPRPARTVLGFAPGGRLEVAADSLFSGTARDGSLVRFRTLADTIAIAATVQAFQVAADGGYLDRTRRLQRGEPFALWGDDPGPGSTFLVGLDRPPTHEPFSLYWTVRDPAESATDRARLAAEAGPAAPPQPAHHSVQLVWEAYAGPGQWVALRSQDETRALTLNGRFLLWGTPLAAPAQLGRVERSLYYLRCRITAGRHDAAPYLLGLVANGVEAEQAAPPRKLAAPPNGTPAPPPEAGANPRFEQLLDGDGWPDQQRALSERPVVASSLQVYTVEDGAWRAWRAQPDFDASGRADADFVLDAQAGVLTFGNGEHGRALPEGIQLYVTYRATRAAAGNGLFTAWAPEVPMKPPPGVTQPRPAWGGSDVETLDQVQARLLDGLARPSRAVTTGDCEALAQVVPGTVVARAQAAGDQHPDLPGVPAPGVISVTILPLLPDARPGPTPGLCCVVSAYLNRRGVIGTRVEVVGPIYQVVTATVTLQAAAGARAEDVRTRAVAALDAFFHPLTGGSAGEGWPVGRDVYRAEVLQALAETAGVESVSALDLSLDGGPPQCGNLCLGPRGLPASGQHVISVVPASSRSRTAQAVP